MRKLVKNNNIKIIVMGALALAVIISIITVCTCRAKSAQKDALREQYYAGLENEYERTLRSLMNEKGYTNAGIAVTHIVDAEGDRTYTVKLHHKKLDRLEKSQREALAEEIEELGFADELCSFTAEFILQ